MCGELNEGFKEFPEVYRIVFIGRKVEGSYMQKLANEMEGRGHECFIISDSEVRNYVPVWDMTECTEKKKKISLMPIEYKYSPDFIFISQTYLRFKKDVKCPIIYNHREYSHFPDVKRPDALVFSYPKRREIFDYYYPYAFDKIKYKENIWVACNPREIRPIRDKPIDISYIGWVIDFWNFIVTNGPHVKLVMEIQEKFFEKCKKIDKITVFTPPVDGERYIELVRLSKASIIDSGYMGGLTRRIFEFAMNHTAMIIRLYNTEQLTFYESIGLTKDMYYGIEKPKDVYKLDFSNINDVTKKAFDWVTLNHTYSHRAIQLENLMKKMKEEKKYENVK